MLLHVVMLAIILGHIEATESCPLTSEAWEESSRALRCQAPNHYHCLRNEKDQLTQECLPRVWIQTGMCPLFNSEAGRMDVQPCVPSSKNCPPFTYWSNVLYLYPGCFEKEEKNTSTQNVQQEDGFDDSSNSSSELSLYVIVSIAVIVLLVLVGSVFLVIVLKRRNVNQGHSPVALQNERTDNLESATEQTETFLGTYTHSNNIATESTRTPKPNIKERKQTEDFETLLGTYTHSNNIATESTRTPKPNIKERKQTEDFVPLNHDEYYLPDERKKIYRQGRNEIQEECISRLRSCEDTTNFGVMSFTSEKKGKILVLLLVKYRDVGQEKISETIQEVFNTYPVYENTLEKWKTKANEKLYVFLDLFSPDSQRADMTNIKRLLSEVVYDAKNNGTKFVLEIPSFIYKANRTFFSEAAKDPCFKVKHLT
ncbi:uncharacterized protein LOC134239887 isoform X1 [Saccostrea cucullata]|uniref:uncharacterized protein LOC134239887 isoform X1 n=1 Tax=Saccostrea cuccullata TaxID=36930 RepID=UPI002ED14312